MSKYSHEQVILRKEYNPYTKEWEPVIFYRDLSQVRIGFIECFNGAHNDATLAYYRKTKKCRLVEAAHLLQILKGNYNIIPVIKKRLAFK